MNLAKRVFRNSLWLAGTQILSRGLSFIIVMILTRYLGIREFGTYSFIYAFCGIFGTVTNIGIDTIVVREASRDLKKSEPLAGNAFLLKCGLSLAAVVLAGVAARATSLPADRTWLITLASLSFFLSPFSLYSTVFAATLNLRYLALIELAERTLSLTFVLLICALGGTLTTVIVALLATAACQSLLIVHYGRRFFRPDFRLDFSLWKGLAHEVVPLAASNLLLILILRIDQIMLARMRTDGDLQLGLYSAAVKYSEIFNYLPALFFASVFPLLSRFSHDRPESFRDLYRLSFKYLLLAIMPAVLVSTLCARSIVTLLFGGNFADAAGPMQLLMWSEPFVFMAWVVINTSVSQGQQRYVLAPVLAALVVNIALNALWIPSRGATGAALASLVSYAMILPLSAWVNQLRPLAEAFLRSAFRPALATLILWLVLRAFSLGLIPCTLIVTAGFLGIVILLGGLDRDDLAMARRMVSREA